VKKDTGQPKGISSQRLVFSLLRAAARLGLRLGLPLKDMTQLQEMAYFREARIVRDMKLEQVAELFDKSLRTVSSLNHRYKDDFFKPEREVAFRRAIAAVINHAPTTCDRLEVVFPEVSSKQLNSVLLDMVRDGLIEKEGDFFRRNPDGFSFVVDADQSARVDGLNRQMDVLAETVEELFLEADGQGRARTWVFQASQADFVALVEEMEQKTRASAIEADAAAEESGDSTTYGITFAATRMKEN